MQLAKEKKLNQALSRVIEFLKERLKTKQPSIKSTTEEEGSWPNPDLRYLCRKTRLSQAIENQKLVPDRDHAWPSLPSGLKLSQKMTQAQGFQSMSFRLKDPLQTRIGSLIWRRETVSSDYNFPQAIDLCRVGRISNHTEFELCRWSERHHISRRTSSASGLYFQLLRQGAMICIDERGDTVTLRGRGRTTEGDQRKFT